MTGSAGAPGVGKHSRTGSARRVYKRNGELLAVPWSTSVGEYDAPKRSEINSTYKVSFKDPGDKLPLQAYDPNALRNRLPVEFDGAPIPFRRFCKVGNLHTYDFMNPGNGAKPPGFNPYRTTNQNFYGYDTMMLSVGESNQGIVSEKAKVLHEKQLS